MVWTQRLQRPLSTQRKVAIMMTQMVPGSSRCIAVASDGNGWRRPLVGCSMQRLKKESWTRRMFFTSTRTLRRKPAMLTMWPEAPLNRCRGVDRVARRFGTDLPDGRPCGRHGPSRQSCQRSQRCWRLPWRSSVQSARMMSTASSRPSRRQWPTSSLLFHQSRSLRIWPPSPLSLRQGPRFTPGTRSGGQRLRRSYFHSTGASPTRGPRPLWISLVDFPQAGRYLSHAVPGLAQLEGDPWESRGPEPRGLSWPYNDKRGSCVEHKGSGGKVPMAKVTSEPTRPSTDESDASERRYEERMQRSPGHER